MIVLQRVLRVVAPSALVLGFALWLVRAPATESLQTAHSTVPAPPRKERVADKKTQRALEGTVRSQLRAFQVADYEGALRHAAASLRDRFTPQSFETMVRGGFRPIAEAKTARFQAAMVAGSEARMLVKVTARDGEIGDYEYLFVREGGAWRITGVVPRHSASPPRTLPRTVVT